MLMQTCNTPQIRDVQWSTIRDNIASLNPHLAAAIDACQPSQQESFWLADLPYGSNLIESGQWRLNQPDQQHPHFPSQVSEFCGVVLNHSVESFHQFSERLAPLHCYLPGEIIGLDHHHLFSQQYGTPASYNLTAGARSLFMLPKITDSASHKNVQREFNIRASTPKKLMQHWDIFRQLAAQVDGGKGWQASVLILPTSLLDPYNKKYHTLQYFLSQQAHQKQEYWRHQYLWDLTFSRIKLKRNLKPNPYLADTCKHLFAIAVGAVPGFTASADEQLAPIKLIQQIYIDVYGLKNYAPVLLQPQRFDSQQAHSPVYYSLQLPTLLEFSPKSRNLSSTISDLREVKHITSTYVSELSKGELGIENTPIANLAQQTAFNFYHSEEDMYGEIEYSQNLLSHDAKLQQAHACFDAQGFSENSPFVRGCIRISQQPQE